MEKKKKRYSLLQIDPQPQTIAESREEKEGLISSFIQTIQETAIENEKESKEEVNLKKENNI